MSTPVCKGDLVEMLRQGQRTAKGAHRFCWRVSGEEAAVLACQRKRPLGRRRTRRSAPGEASRGVPRGSAGGMTRKFRSCRLPTERGRLRTPRSPRAPCTSGARPWRDRSRSCSQPRRRQARRVWPDAARAAGSLPRVQRLGESEARQPEASRNDMWLQEPHGVASQCVLTRAPPSCPVTRHARDIGHGYGCVGGLPRSHLPHPDAGRCSDEPRPRQHCDRNHSVAGPSAAGHQPVGTKIRGISLPPVSFRNWRRRPPSARCQARDRFGRRRRKGRRST
jgi:hypothetical protein